MRGQAARTAPSSSPPRRGRRRLGDVTDAVIGLALIQQIGVLDPLGAFPFLTSATPALFWLIGG